MKLPNRLALVAMVVAVPLLARAQDVTMSTVTSPSSAASTDQTTFNDTAVDPGRLVAAHRIVDRVFPTGTYARIMGSSMDAVMGPAIDGMTAMPVADIARMGGAKPEDIAKLGKGTIAQMMTILDPAYRQRIQITAKVMAAEMGAVMTQIEPGMRDALSRAYARRFDLAQLGDLNRFFDSPTGRVYATESMTIMTDPDVLKQVQSFIPLLMKQMPDIGAKIQAATASLPKQRSYNDLSAAEKERLTKLIGEATPASP